ncbi:MAG TPA: OmpH family outer membrane protein [Pyrinomonadaceae bacterium]|jgi:Skp family chaperone for outer membrane proteins|nr:OmpH family outer membrane protein [Pyrinomonadaceae bacterium]
MKRVSFIAATFLIVLGFALPIFAQAGAQQTGKIGIINTAAFLGDKVNIARLLTAVTTLDKEFEPRQQELVTMNTRVETLAKEIQSLQAQLNNAKPQAPIDTNSIRNSIISKNEEGERLQIEMKRKQEDGKAAYEKREAVVLGPIQREIFNSINEYAKTKGFSLVFDGAKMADAGILIGVGDSAVDVTEDFIKYFNAKPATTASTAKPATGTAAKPN